MPVTERQVCDDPSHPAEETTQSPECSESEEYWEGMESEIQLRNNFPLQLLVTITTYKQATIFQVPKPPPYTSQFNLKRTQHQQQRKAQEAQVWSRLNNDVINFVMNFTFGLFSNGQLHIDIHRLCWKLKSKNEFFCLSGLPILSMQMVQTEIARFEANREKLVTYGFASFLRWEISLILYLCSTMVFKCLY